MFITKTKGNKMKQIKGITRESVNNLLSTAAAFTMASMSGSGVVFAYMILTQGPRLNTTAGNVAAALVAIMAMAAVVLVAIMKTMYNINKKAVK